MANFFKAKLNNGKVEVSGDSSCLLGRKTIKDTCGVYLQWDWDGSKLMIENDYSGNYNCYYYCRDGEIIVSDSIIALIENGADTKFDELAISFFARAGFFVRDMTPFEHIKALPANSKAIWQDGKLEIDSRPIIHTAANLTVDQAVDGYIDLFRQAMKRRLPETDDFVLPLSGGRDSRQMLFELLRSGHKPSLCITCGEERDRKVVEIIKERCDLNHRHIYPIRSWGDYLTRKNILTEFCALEHGWLMILGDFLNEIKPKLSYDGAGVGVLTRSTLLGDQQWQMCKDGRYEDLARFLFDSVGFSEEMLKMLPGKYDFISKNSDVVLSLFSEVFAEYSDAANPMCLFNFYNWNRRETNLSVFGLQKNIEVQTPFLDKDLFEFVSTISPDLALECEPQAEAVKRAFPEYADIPFYDEFEKEISKRSLKSKIFNFASSQSTLFKPDMSGWWCYMRSKLPSSKSYSGEGRTKIFDLLVYMMQLNEISRKWS